MVRALINFVLRPYNSKLSDVGRMKLNAKWSVIPLLVALSACGHSGLPATPLFVGVEGKNYSEGTRLIQGRLRARFPKGSSEGKLGEYLKEQGLRVERVADPSASISGVASIKYGSSFCGSQVRVSWTADAAGKIESVEAMYSDTGCS